MPGEFISLGLNGVKFVKVLLFGVGANTKKVISCLKEETEILGFLDNDAQKWGNTYEQKNILSPQEGLKQPFDYLILSVAKGYDRILEQMKNYGVEEDKIIWPFSFPHEKYKEWRKIFYIEELIYWEMNQRIEEMSFYLKNLKYETAAKLEKGEIAFPKILSAEKAIHEIAKNRKSMSRYGDGEWDLALGYDNSFQKSDKRLQERLKEILVSNLDNHIVAIPDIYGDFPNRTEEFKACFRRHLGSGRREQEYAMLDMEKEYYDSFITRPYKDFVDRSNAGRKFEQIKTIWEGRNLTIVEGEKSRLGMGNDLFSNAASCIRILCPPINAFDQYHAIFNAVKETDKENLILIALGATATVLAYDLAREGYQAVDIGHIDIEYEWYLCHAENSIPIQGKYVNEASGGRIVSDEKVDNKYRKEVWKIIRER